MKSPAALAGLALVGALVSGCGVVEDLPDDETLASCLTAAGVDPDDLGGAEERHDAFAAEPAALDCVAGMTSASDREAVLGGVFEDQDDLWPVLAAYIDSLGDYGQEKIADSAGRVMAGADGDGFDEDDEFEEGWTKEALNSAVAVAAHIREKGELPASFATFLEDTGKELPAGETPPYLDYAYFSDWSSEEDPALWKELNDIQDFARSARDS